MIKNTAYERILGRVEIETIIKRINGKKLKQTERNYLSRSIRPKLIAAKLLTEAKILEKINAPDLSLDKKIIFNLSKHGYELILPGKIKKQKKISVEELIALILAKMPVPRFIEAIPILLLKNKVDKFKLVEISCKHGINNQLGYLVEITILIAKKLKMKTDFDGFYGLLMYLKNNKNKEVKSLGEEKDKDYQEFLMTSSPKRVRRWYLLGRFFDDDFIKTAKVYL